MWANAEPITRCCQSEKCLHGHLFRCKMGRPRSAAPTVWARSTNVASTGLLAKGDRQVLAFCACLVYPERDPGMTKANTRREFLVTSAAAGTALVLSSCARPNNPRTERVEKQSVAKEDESENGSEVTATEDLMREHGVLRRVLLVYSSAAVKLRGNPTAVPPDALQKTAKLFRSFGEEYHEKKLEEAYIFPADKTAGGDAATYPDILVVQHNRGREITDYIINLTVGTKLDSGKAQQLAAVLDAFVFMYRNHAAREDTIIFPAWKGTMTEQQLDEMGEKFEDIEKAQFGDDGFEDAVKQISEIESSLNLTDISQFTAPPPPKI